MESTNLTKIIYFRSVFKELAYFFYLKCVFQCKHTFWGGSGGEYINILKGTCLLSLHRNNMAFA